MLLIALITFLNLRGVRESGTAFAIPTYAFMAAIFLMVGWAIVRMLRGRAAGRECRLGAGGPGLLQGPGTALSRCAVVHVRYHCADRASRRSATGSRRSRSRSRRTPRPRCCLLGVISMTMFASITWLAVKTGVQVAEHDETSKGCRRREQKTVIAQIANAVFSNAPALA